MAREQDFLVDQRIQIIGVYFLGGELVQFVDHVAKQVEFIQGRTQMHADLLPKEDPPGLLVGALRVHDPQDNPEVGTQIF